MAVLPAMHSTWSATETGSGGSYVGNCSVSTLSSGSM
jgi:hypothetical protein